MRLQAIASGSNGNCFLIEDEGSLILIDDGISFKKLRLALQRLSLSPSSIDYVLITHAHSDHVSGLPVLFSNTSARIVASEGTLLELEGLSSRDSRYHVIANEAIPIEVNDPIVINNFQVTAFQTFHDILGAVGFHLQHLPTDIEISYATDTAGISAEFKERMKSSEYIFLESNHDRGMLQTSRRPPDLKQRIRRTHLSNSLTVDILDEVISGTTRAVFLGHLSGECNTPELVASHIQKLRRQRGDSFTWIICPRHESSTLVEVGSTPSFSGGISSVNSISLANSALDHFFS